MQVKQSLLRSAPAAPALLGSYHYVYGVDCSSAAGVAAYFNTLVNDMPNPHMSKVSAGWSTLSSMLSRCVVKVASWRTSRLKGHLAFISTKASGIS
jgi:hypothetical protein